MISTPPNAAAYTRCILDTIIRSSLQGWLSHYQPHKQPKSSRISLRYTRNTSTPLFLFNRLETPRSIQAFFSMINVLHRHQCHRYSTHHQAFQWSQAHSSIYTFTIFDSGNRTTITNMTSDFLPTGFTPKFAYTFGHVTMRCSVEAITTHTILFIQFMRNSIHVQA